MSSPMTISSRPSSSLAVGLRAKEEEPEKLSADELRSHLFQSLQAKGVLSQLKSQLRCRLVQELRRGTPGATPPLPLALQVANSVVAEHLRRCGYEYSLSTFLPEAHTSADNILSRDDIIHYLHLQPSSPLSTALNNDTGRGFLRDLLGAISSGAVGGATCDHTHHSTGVQTDGEEGRGERGPLSLADRLRRLDELHVAQLGEKDGRGEAREVWKKECEERLRAQMKREMDQFRDRELGQAREEERKKCETELRNQWTEQEEKHQKKMESIRRLEQDTVDRLHRKELESEAALYAKRQELQLQLQAVESREEQLRRDIGLQQQTVGLAEQRITAAAEQLTARERELGQYRQQLEATLQERDLRCRHECELQLKRERGELAEWEARLKVEQRQQTTVNAELQQARQQGREERERRETAEGLLHDATRRLVELQKQREVSHKAMEKLSEHGVLKQQLTELRIHVAKTERKLSESRTEHHRMQGVIKGLRKQLGHPDNGQLHVVEEAERLKREYQLKLTEAEEEKRELRRELSRQVGVAAQQRSQLEEQALGLREMEREVTDLSVQLAHWQSALLHKARSLDKTGLEQASSLLSSPPPPTLPSSPPHPPHSTHHSPPHPSSHLLSESKAALVHLEQEAIELESYYQQLDQRLASGHPAHILTPLPGHTRHTGTAPLASHHFTLPHAVVSSHCPVPMTVSRPVIVISSSAPVTYLTSVTRTTPTTTSKTTPTSVTRTTPTTTSKTTPTSVTRTTPTTITKTTPTSDTRTTPTNTTKTTPTSVTRTTPTSANMTTSTPASFLLPTTIRITHPSLPTTVTTHTSLPTIITTHPSLPTTVTTHTSLPTTITTHTSLPTTVSTHPSLPTTVTTHTSLSTTHTVPHPPASSAPGVVVSQLPAQTSQLSLDDLWTQPQMAQSTSSEQLSASNHHEPCSVPRPDYAHNSASVVSDGQITDSSPDPQPTNSLSPVTGQPTSKSETRSTAETIRTVPPELLATANEGATLLHTPATSDSAVPTSLPSTASVEDRGEGEGGVDPLMLKYMELVKQRREGETKHLPSSHSPQSEHSQGIGLRSLSHVTDSFVCSEAEQGSDPFHNW